MSWEPNPCQVVVVRMMTNIQTVAKKIFQPVVVAIAMLFLTPVAALLQAAIKAPFPVQVTTNETVVYKTAQSSVAYKI
jgi:lipopolysaccharide/colanic/teichoic acid biosynthesis glycosyltransferase